VYVLVEGFDECGDGVGGDLVVGGGEFLCDECCFVGVRGDFGVVVDVGFGCVGCVE